MDHETQIGYRAWRQVTSSVFESSRNASSGEQVRQAPFYLINVGSYNLMIDLS